ncbi:hypothetical protein [Marinobacter sp.]|uniref:hypothetical protein n=1 Tax=Marinobacter sp. TaxID=50741 RepID=UPI00257A849D|nr:hypothetical protein [Marinobacter sp.]|tara:strand:+ start:923 stop:1594 length:672 start_codon:yes stop_codon:yes gene_type:complete
MLQYLYLNQILEFTKGRLGPQQILHAASNGLIKLYAHTPELNELASRISPISAADCAIIEREYNACAAAAGGDFSRCGFLMAGGVTEAMCQGEEPFFYFLEAWSRSIGDGRLQWEELNEDGYAYRVQFRLFGSDFIVFKADVESLLKGSGANNHGGAREDIDTRERTTYLKLIRMLCELQDIDISQPYKAYEVLAELAASKGIALPGSENNIATKLKAARDID